MYVFVYVDKYFQNDDKQTADMHSLLIFLDDEFRDSTSIHCHIYEC